jgi:hypothetical protein
MELHIIKCPLGVTAERYTVKSKEREHIWGEAPAFAQGARASPALGSRDGLPRQLPLWLHPRESPPPPAPDATRETPPRHCWHSMERRLPAQLSGGPRGAVLTVGFPPVLPRMKVVGE